MSDLPISKATSNVTFSQESEAGRMRYGLQAGRRTSPSGQAHVLASLTPRQALEKGMTTRGPYGGRGDGLWISADLQLSLENRLRARLDVNGSPEYALTWKQWDMPSGPPICALRASVRRTSGNGCGGWRTPSGSDGEGGTMDVLMAMREGYTPKLKLRDQAPLAGWLTPRADESSSDKQRNGRPNLQGLARMASGTMQSGPPAPTEKRGALNPAFSLWLMGFPDDWHSCGVRAMQSSRRSRRCS